MADPVGYFLILISIMFLVAAIWAYYSFIQWFRETLESINSHQERIEYLLEFLTDRLVDEEAEDEEAEALQQPISPVIGV